MKDIESIPKLTLGILPTPLYRLDNISKIIGKNIFIKRDDMTGVAFGGNKVRKLEYLLYDAMIQGYDTIITTGAAQSNHAMITAACCKRLGLDVVLVLKQRGVTDKKGNLLLNDLMGVRVIFVDSDTFTDVYAKIDSVADELRQAGKKPYIIPVGASVPLGSLGYVNCVKEMMGQAAAQQLHIDHIVCCDGSGGTHAGIALGAGIYSNNTKVTGIVVSPENNFQGRVYKMIEGICEIMGINNDMTLDDVVMKDYVGPGYALPSEAGIAAMRLMAENEGIFLDPVYTGKTFAGLIDLSSKGYFNDDENIVFMHSGGGASLFAVPIDLK